MRALFALVFVIGLGLAGFAAKLIQGHLTQQQAALEAERASAATKVEVVPIFAVKHAMKYGDRITPDDIGQIPYPVDFLPEGTFATLEDVFPEGENVPRMVIRALEPFEPLLAAKLTAPGASAGLVTRLDKGKRAFTIRTDVTSGVSGFLRPGDRVDVFWTGTPPGGGYGEVTRLIDSAVEIMAINQTDNTTMSDTQVAQTVTVMVTSQQVASLAQAQSSGRLSLALVGTNDDAVAEVIEVDQNSLLGIQAAPQAPQEIAQAPAQICTVRNRKGAEVIEIEVPCTN